MTDIHLDRPVDVSNGDEEESFDTKYLKFRSDPDKMQEMNEFVNNLIADAEQQADTQLEAKKVNHIYEKPITKTIFNVILFYFSWRNKNV